MGIILILIQDSCISFHILINYIPSVQLGVVVGGGGGGGGRVSRQTHPNSSLSSPKKIQQWLVVGFFFIFERKISYKNPRIDVYSRTKDDVKT